MSRPALAALHVYPLKATRGHDLAEAAVEPWGLAGDRRWMLFDGAGLAVTQRSRPRLALVTAHLLPDGGLRVSAPGSAALHVPVPESGATTVTRLFRDKVELLPATAAAHRWFSTYLGTEVRLGYLGDPAGQRPVNPRYAQPGETVSLADGYPLLLTSRPSLDALNSLVAAGEYAAEGPLPMDRFRPNVVVTGTPPWAEDRWRRIAIGEVVFRVVKPCGRCLVTTVDQATGERGREPLRSLARHRRLGRRLAFGQNLVPETTGTLRLGDPVTILDQVDA